MAKTRTAADIARRQTQPDALRLLLAQRKLYSRAKRFSNARSLGYFAIAFAGPLLVAVWPASAEACGAVAGGWLFLTRTVFEWRQDYWQRKGASVQQRYDWHVFDFPDDPVAPDLPTLEDLADVIGPNADSEIIKHKLHRWYPVRDDLPFDAGVAIAQRSNAAYSKRLLERHAMVWLSLGTLWLVVALVVAIACNISTSHVLLGLVLPVLPAVLDAKDIWRASQMAARDRGALAKRIEDLIRRRGAKPIDELALLSMQEQQFQLRRTSPLVPDVLYWRLRKRNEAAMTAAADELGQLVMGER